MRISGTEPSSVILSQTKKFKKFKSYAQKVQKSSKSQKGWCNKPTKLQFRYLLTRNILIFSNATNHFTLKYSGAFVLMYITKY